MYKAIKHCYLFQHFEKALSGKNSKKKVLQYFGHITTPSPFWNFAQNENNFNGIQQH